MRLPLQNLGNTCSWFFGVVFGITGLGLMSQDAARGLLVLASAAIILPYTRRQMEENGLHRKMPMWILVIAFLAAFAFAGKTQL